MFKNIFIVAFVVTLLIACGNESNFKSEASIEAEEIGYDGGISSNEDMAINPAPKKGTSSKDESSKSEQKKKVIRTAEIRVKVKDLRQFGNTVTHKAELLNGFVESSDEYENSASIVIKVPEDKFQEFINYLEQKGEHFEHKTISSQDVTTEFIDVSARIKTKKALEARYVELLKKAKDIPEIMEVERQIESVRSHIESMEGRLKYLTRQTSYSTIHLNYYKHSDIVVEKGFEFFKTVAQNFLDGWYGVLRVLAGLVLIWPGLLFFLIGFFIVYRKFIRGK